MKFDHRSHSMASSTLGRRSFHRVVFLFSILCVNAIHSEEFTPFKAVMAMRANGQTLNFYLYFDSHYAVQFDTKEFDKLLVVYDLDAKSWTDFDPQRVVQKSQYEEWYRRTVEKTRKSLASSTDVELNKFVTASLDPKFKVTRSGDGISLENEFLNFELSKPVSLTAAQRKRFFEYDRVNAFRKAMIERKMSPSTQLAVDEELEPRDFVPGSMVMTVKTPKGSVQLNCTTRVMPFDAADTEPVADAIHRAKMMRDAKAQKQSVNPKAQ